MAVLHIKCAMCGKPIGTVDSTAGNNTFKPYADHNGEMVSFPCETCGRLICKNCERIGCCADCLVTEQ